MSRNKRTTSAPPALMPWASARVIAVAANCDPRTVQRYVGGEEVRPLACMRIDAALILLDRTDVKDRRQRNVRRLRHGLDPE